MMLGKVSGYILQLIGYVDSLYGRAEFFPFNKIVKTWEKSRF